MVCGQRCHLQPIIKNKSTSWIQSNDPIYVGAISQIQYAGKLQETAHIQINVNFLVVALGSFCILRIVLIDKSQNRFEIDGVIVVA